MAASLSVAPTGELLAQAADECACVVPMASLPQTGPIGQLQTVSGNVMLISAAGPQAASSGTPLTLGDQVTVGSQSVAVFEIGDCALQLPEFSEMTATPLNGNICVRVEDTSVQAGVGQDLTPLIVGAGALGIGGGILLFTLGDDDPVSP